MISIYLSPALGLFWPRVSDPCAKVNQTPAARDKAESELMAVSKVYQFPDNK